MNFLDFWGVGRGATSKADAYWQPLVPHLQPLQGFCESSFSILRPLLLAIPREASRLAGCSPTYFLFSCVPNQTRCLLAFLSVGCDPKFMDCDPSQLGTTFGSELNSQHLKASMLFSFLFVQHRQAQWPWRLLVETVEPQDGREWAWVSASPFGREALGHHSGTRQNHTQCVRGRERC